MHLASSGDTPSGTVPEGSMSASASRPLRSRDPSGTVPAGAVSAGDAPAETKAVPVWRLAHPLWLCGFRSFFLATLLAGLGLVALWLLFLGLGWPLPAVPGGAQVWHVHELLFGLSLAAVAGFALTAVPEFTGTRSFRARHVRQLLAWWLAGRMAFWLSGFWPPVMLALAGAAHVGFAVMLTALIGPRLWRDPGHRQQGFWWALLALVCTVTGFYVDALRDEYPMRWLHATLGVLMCLIVVAMSRISMSIVNASIDDLNAEEQRAARQVAQTAAPAGQVVAGGTPNARMGADAASGGLATATGAVLPASAPRVVAGHDDDEREAYLARPPRRHLAVICITLFTVMQWFAPDDRVTGWLALASSAAMLNLLNDWHVGRPLFARWPLMLYMVYVFMAAGYGLIGLVLVAGDGSVSPGIHLLTAGALGLAVYTVICIAGYTHSGLEKNGRPWVVVGACLLVASAVLRALAYWFDPPVLLQLAGLAWCAAFVMQGWQMLPVFLRPRQDGLWGCQGVQE